jgi:hypothetical protein
MGLILGDSSFKEGGSTEPSENIKKRIYTIQKAREIELPGFLSLFRLLSIQKNLNCTGFRLRPMFRWEELFSSDMRTMKIMASNVY